MLFPREIPPGRVLAFASEQAGMAEEDVRRYAAGRPAALMVKNRVAYHLRVERGLSLPNCARAMRCHYSTVRYYVGKYLECLSDNDELMQPWW